MPRAHRLEVPDGVFHVVSRGNRREPVVLDERDCRRFLALVGGTVKRFEWFCLAYCLMDNHFHLLVETPRPNLAQGMQWLKGTYARLFNDKYGLVGHLFQGRYGSELVVDESHRLEVARYVVLNPVRAGVERFPERYRWSSYAATVGQVKPPPFLAVDRLLEAYGGSWVGQARFKAFVEDQLVHDLAELDMTWGLTPAVAVRAA